MTDHKALARRLYEAITQGNLDAMDEIVHADVVEHEELGDLPPGREGVKAWFSLMRDAFPDLSTEVDAIVAEGDEVWVQAVFRGTHEGEFMGAPATGRSFTMNVMDRFRFADGRVAEHWGVADQVTMMTQLGLTEPPVTG